MNDNSIEAAQYIVAQMARDNFTVIEQHLTAIIKPLQFKSYPGLYHPFIPVEGEKKATPATYTIPGHVSEEVVNDIARWVNQTLKHAS